MRDVGSPPTGSPLSAPPSLTAPAFADNSLEVDCPDCVDDLGLCHADHCRRQVLPQLASPRGLLALIGETRVEQTKRQQKRQKPAPESPQHRAYNVRRANARAVARSKRRGAYGLARAIMERHEERKA